MSNLCICVLTQRVYGTLRGLSTERSMYQICVFVLTQRVCDTLRGLSTERSMDVVFHVIIPKLFWEWDSSSQVCLRFGGTDLGDWGQNVGIFSFR